MSNYDNTNRGAIWKNDDKQKDTHPDFKGNLNVNGVEFWVSAWKRKPDANPKSPALSFSIQPKDESHREGVEQARQAAPEPVKDFDDDIPF